MLDIDQGEPYACRKCSLTAVRQCPAHPNGTNFKEVTPMEQRNDIPVAKILVGLTLAVCVAAIFDPRLRKACLGLLCRL